MSMAIVVSLGPHHSVALRAQVLAHEIPFIRSLFLTAFVIVR